MRIGVTGLARSGKTVLLSAIAASLLAPPGHRPFPGRLLGVRVAPGGAGTIPRFDPWGHLAALAADPPRWPARTDAVSLLALELEVDASPLPPRRLRLELLDYPGEWLLDLPLLSVSFAQWSGEVLDRLERLPAAAAAEAVPFLRFVRSLPAGMAADEALAASGHRLYRALLNQLRDRHGLSLLQPGRFLMPPPGAEPPWMEFFPILGNGGLVSLMGERFEAYKTATRNDLASPSFGRIDRLVVLADLLGALHTGQVAFADAQAALRATARALHWRGSWLATLSAMARFGLPAPAIGRVAFAATKADHVGERQRGNLESLLRNMVSVPATGSLTEAMATAPVPTACFALAALRCTEDFVWSLDGHPVSAVRGRLIGGDRLTRSYPGEVPDVPPDATFWQHPFLKLPDFEPVRLPSAGRNGVPNIGLSTLLGFLLEDIL
ncbi:YcjX family protein [Rhizosaccharibacter radicis]|uniref:YcjX family protein n=1 Tax=Rhizosaccharibacter radicis TaxID=2782605 RepID=A0ABT1VUV3_9PROT|nr:YcjX family protein [Acetobacteraceae bacterium KSS12]